MRQAPPSIVSLLFSDSQLARLAAKGDEQAVEAIFRRHQPDLYRFCLAMTGDPQRAQEATQGTLARVRRGLPDKDRSTKLKPWLYRIARDEVSAVQPPPARHAEAETEQSRAQARRLLTDLERLPQHQRAVLVMRELSGLDFDQIGSAFETSPAAARETLYEARLRLQQVGRSREASCAETMRRLSDADGRAQWRLGLQLHLRGCPDCRAFRDQIASRRGGLTAVAAARESNASDASDAGIDGQLAAPSLKAVARSDPSAAETPQPQPAAPGGVLDPRAEPPVEDVPDESAVPLPAPPAPEAEPPSGGPDRSRHRHRDRPWRKHR